MRVKLKGIASATKILASGEKVTYHYAWRGGPRLDGEPGSPEFMLSYERALNERPSPDSSVFKSIIADYLASVDFTGLRERTKADYQKHIATIERAFGDLPTAALTDPKVTGEFLRWRDRIGGRQGDYAWSVLMLILSHGRTVGMTSYRPPGRIRKLYEADRSDKIWEAHHIDAFIAVAPATLQWALVFATETAQRQADLLRLPWSSFDGKYIRLTPSVMNGYPGRGGVRPGAGRPAGSKNQRSADVARQAAEAGITPIEVMLNAMRELWDQGSLDAKREAARIAKDAAPIFTHA